MRIKSLLLGDLLFQWKYGFYFLYFFIGIFYCILLRLLPPSWTVKASTIIIFSDPSAIGLFFIGAILLLEKNQRVLDSLSISPIKVHEYIIAKVLSLGTISTLMGLVLSLVAGSQNLRLILLGTFLGSALFTLLGIMIASGINSLNQFILYTIPALLLMFLPPLVFLFVPDYIVLWLHPGTLILSLISGNSSNLPFTIVLLSAWIALFYFLACKYAEKMFRRLGGAF